MQTLVAFIVIFASSVAWAAPRLRFELKVQTPYSKEWTQVFQDGKSWTCKTEKIPEVKSQEALVSEQSLGALPTKVRKGEKCQTYYVAHGHLGKKPTKYAGCYEAPETAEFFRKLASSCGR